MRVAEQYVEAFGRIAKEGTTVVLPANAGDVSGMVTQALSVFRAMQGSQGWCADADHGTLCARCARSRAASARRGSGSSSSSGGRNSNSGSNYNGGSGSSGSHAIGSSGAASGQGDDHDTAADAGGADRLTGEVLAGGDLTAGLNESQKLLQEVEQLQRSAPPRRM